MGGKKWHGRSTLSSNNNNNMHVISNPGQVGNDEMKEKDMEQERKKATHKYV